MRARRVPRLTLASSTPGILRKARSLRTAQAAQGIPPMAKVVVAIFGLLSARVGDDGELGARRHHAHAAVEAKLSGLLRHERNRRRASIREKLADAEARREQETPAPGGLTGIDPPFNRHALFDREAIGDIAEAVNPHHHDLFALRRS